MIVRAISFSAKRDKDGFAYFTVQFYRNGVLHKRREIYSSSPNFDRVFYGDLGPNGTTVLFPWAEAPVAPVLIPQQAIEPEGTICD